MSVGGKVCEVIVLPDRVWVDTRERSYKRTCAIYVERDARAECIEPGDGLWWQGRFAMWTPRAGGRPDIRLRRIGYSGASRPDLRALAPSAETGKEAP